MQNQHRQLAAILFTDIVGYTAMMQQNEAHAVATVKHYISVLQKTVLEHEGKVLNDYGDGSLCSFASATQAVRCALEMQQQLQITPSVPLRIGLHVGEIFFEEGKVLGDGVNVASRIQSLGQANTILFSREICDKIRNQPEFKSVSLGMFEFKNVDQPIEVFALSNDGLIVPRRENMEGKLKEIKKRVAQRRWVIWAIVILLALSCTFFIYKRVIESESFTGGEKSIAVLPFDNIGVGDSNAYLSDGITEEIINNLSRISSLQKVIAWFSVKGFKNTTKSAKEIADELGVAAILTGTIQYEAGNIHIIVELIDVNTNKRLWGDELNYNNNDILSIQSSVAGEIVAALKAKITPEEKKNLSKNYTVNLEAYKFYLKGRHFWYIQGPDNFDSAESNYERAIKLQPDFALAYAGLADCYDVNYKGLPQLEEVPIAKMYAAKALSLDSSLSEALTTMGFIQQNYDYNWPGAIKNLKKAISLDPNNAAAHMYYGLAIMNSTSDIETALGEMKKAVDLDPLSYITNWMLARNYYFAGKYDLAIDQFEKMESFTPQNLRDVPIFSIGLIYLKKQLYSKAKEYFNKLPEANRNQIDNNQVMQSYALAVMGDTSKAITLLQKTLKKYPNLSPYRNSQVYVAVGNFDEAINQLELGYASRDLHMFWIKVDPAFDPIKNDPRFIALLKKMNLE